MQRSTPPVRKVIGDNYTVEVDGVTYHPHAGDWVDFVSSSTVNEMTLALKFQRLSNMAGSEASTDLFEELSRTLDEILETLSRGITDWSWSDARGEKLDSPPDIEQLRKIDLNEILWLVSKKTTKDGEDERKNVSSTSTSPSKVRTPRRQRNG